MIIRTIEWQRRGNEMIKTVLQASIIVMAFAAISLIVMTQQQAKAQTTQLKTKNMARLRALGRQDKLTAGDITQVKNNNIVYKALKKK